MPPKTRSSALSFDSGPALSSLSPTGPSFARDNGAAISNGPTFLSRNKTERGRLQGLTRTMSNPAAGGEGVAKRALGMAERFKVWMVNEGEPCGYMSLRDLQSGRNRLFMLVWIVLHLVAFAFSLVHYQLKDNLVGARAAFGYTFSTLP